MTLARAVAVKSTRSAMGQVNNMAIKPKCDKCGEELKDLGGILLSPPNKEGMVKKLHLCRSCYKDVFRGLRKE